MTANARAPTKHEPLIREVFLRAFEIESGEERDIYLCQACEDQPALRRQVDSLLSAYPRRRAWLDDAEEEDSIAVPGQQIGRYRLVRELGEPL